MGPKKTTSGSKLTTFAKSSSSSKPKATSKPQTSGVAKRTTKTTASGKNATKSTATTSKATTASKTSSKATTKLKAPAGPTKEDVAAIKIQKIVRGFLAQVELRRLRIKKDDYNKMIDDLQRQAWLEIIERQRKEDEIALQKEEEIRKRKRQELKWRRDILEAAFDGELDKIEAILEQALDETRKNSSLIDDGLERVLRKTKMNLLHCEDANGNSTLSEAAAGGDVDTINFFLNNGASVNKLAQHHRTPLYRAAFGGHLEAVNVLLQRGCDPRITDNDGVTPQQISAAPEIAQVIGEWDVLRTDALLIKLDEEKEKERSEEEKIKKMEQEKVDKTIRELETEYSLEQKMLQKAHEELNKRINEHDNCVAEKFERLDVTLQAIHDAEDHLLKAQKKERECREKLAAFRLQIREEQTAQGNDDEDDWGVKCHIKEMDDVLMRDVGNKIKLSARWPLLSDSSGQAVTFLKYRDTNYLNTLNPKDMEPDTLRLALLGSIRYGKQLVLDMMEMNLVELIESRFDDIHPHLYQLVMSKDILKDRKYELLIKESDGKEYAKENFVDSRVERFMLIVVSKLRQLPDAWREIFYVIRIVTPAMS